MTKNNLPFPVFPLSKAQTEKIIQQYPTPFHIYNEKGFRETARKLYKAFSWAHDYKNYFAVKTTPNPYIHKILIEEGMGLDCSSMAELLIAEKLGLRGAQIMFSSNDTPYQEYKKAAELNAIINLDDIGHIAYIEKYLKKLPSFLSFRYNPGPRLEVKSVIGNPIESKFGLTRDQIFEAYEIAQKKGVKKFGIHTMVASNLLDNNLFIKVAEEMFELILEINKKLGIRFEFVDFGGGYGIPYKLEDKPLDLDYISREMKILYDKIIKKNGLDPLNIVMEQGRFITGLNGYLIAKVRHVKHSYKDYVGLDATMADLMRPALYGAYHHEIVLGKESAPENHIYDVVGSLCENNDKFAIDRKLPKVEQDDIIIIHNAGAHGRAMGFNYNGKLRSAELLLEPNGSVKQIRRAETVDDYFATLDFRGL